MYWYYRTAFGPPGYGHRRGLSFGSRRELGEQVVGKLQPRSVEFRAFDGTPKRFQRPALLPFDRFRQRPNRTSGSIPGADPSPGDVSPSDPGEPLVRVGPGTGAHHQSAA